MIRHVSVLTFSDAATAEQVDAAVVGLRRLPALIPELRNYCVGPDLGLDTGNASFVVIGDFDDAAAYAIYRDHPEHRAVAVEHIVPILAGRSAAQYEI